MRDRFRTLIHNLMIGSIDYRGVCVRSSMMLGHVMAELKSQGATAYELRDAGWLAFCGCSSAAACESGNQKMLLVALPSRPARPDSCHVIATVRQCVSQRASKQVKHASEQVMRRGGRAGGADSALSAERAPL